MSQKHIFIGLGGAGVNTVSQIKYKIYQKAQQSASKTRFDYMNETYRFLFIDTDARDLEFYNKKYAETFEQGRIKFIDPQTDLVSLSKGNPQAIYMEAERNPEPLINQRILEACSAELAAKIPDQPLKFGAGAFRMKSRISFARSLSEFQQKLQAHIEALNSVKNSGGEENTIFYWVVCSTNGGTGSGIINDVLYAVNMQHKRSIGDGDPHLVLTMYMPKFYIDKNSTEEKYSLNAFAVFSEIEAVKSMSMDDKRNKVFHRLAFSKDYNLNDDSLKYDPFYYLIPVDCQTDNGTNIGDGMYSNTAEMLYYIHDGKGGAALHSDVDNYMHDLYNERPKGFLVPMGYIALRKPEEEFRNYMSARMKQDILLYGLYNKDCKKATDTEVDDFYATAFKTAFDDAVSSIKEEVLDEGLPESLIKDENDKTKLRIDNEDGFDQGKGAECLDEFKGQVTAWMKENKDDCVKKISATLWERAENVIITDGLEYAKDLYKRLIDKATSELKVLTGDENKRSFEEICEESELPKKYQLASEFTFSERFKPDDQRNQIEQFFGDLISCTQTAIECDTNLRRAELINEFISSDGNSGKLRDLYEHIDNLFKTVEDLANDAGKEYQHLALHFNEKALDVTSVYLPAMKNICDGNGWIKGNFFSYCYELLFKPSQEMVENKDNKPMRKGPRSITQFLEDEIYSNNGKYAKDIKKAGYEVADKIRFLANENLYATSTAKSLIEKFITYCQRAFEDKIERDPDIKSKWYDKPIAKFFDVLDNSEKDKVRSSLRPSLFFNYRENRIAVDYREFLIFVAPDPDLASVMLGYQAGNPNHRFIASTETNAAFVIRAKYGLSFSEYRLYDTLKERYEKAPFREKYHFHRYFAEYGEELLLEDLPYEISPAHRVYAKMLFLTRFEPMLKDFFYKSEYKSQQDDFETVVLKVNEENGTFSVARPKAIGERDGKICISVKDKNTKLFVDFEGNDFVEAFGSYQRDFIRNSISETYARTLMAIKRHKILIDEQSADGKQKEKKEKSGEAIISENFNAIRKELLKELDEKAFTAVREAEKSIYTILFRVLDQEVCYPKNL